MDRSVDVRTPESIAFSYHLAGLGSRFLAVFIDQVIQIAVLVGVVVALVMASSRLPEVKHVAAAGEKTGEAILVAFVVFVVFLIFFGYFILFEAFWGGQTPGKRLLGIRVVRDGGYPLDFGASVIRNLIRVGEYALGYYAVAAISAVLSPENKRLGDIAAGTIVVRDARMALPAVLAGGPEPVYAATTYLSGDERSLIRRFLERRDVLEPARRKELAAQLAARVRPRVPVELQRLDDEALLERL
jgi:uncharacterized RDD family membrane protein YckC